MVSRTDSVVMRFESESSIEEDRSGALRFCDDGQRRK